MPSLRIKPTTPEHEACALELANVLKKYAEPPYSFTSEELFGVMCNRTGAMLAMMDQRLGVPFWTDFMVKNIQYGNESVVNQLHNSVDTTKEN